MPKKNFGRDVSRLHIQLISCQLKLAKIGMPVASIWLHENEPQVHGTRYLKGLLSNIEQEEVDSAIKLDVMNLASPEPDEPLLDIESDAPEYNLAKSIFKNSSPNSGPAPDLLPLPLSCMNQREKYTWITKEILKEQQNKSTSSVVSSRVKYGVPDLQPSFWSNEDWEWGQMTKHFSNIASSSYTGPGTLLEFVTKLIVRCLTQFGKDPETHVVPDVDKKILAKRKKIFRVHESTHIVEDSDSLNGEQNHSADVQNEEIQAQESHRCPLEHQQPEPTVFKPRRNLPDSTPLRTPAGVATDTADCGPPPPSATPVCDDQTQTPPSPPQPQSYTYIESEHNFTFSQIVEPTLAETDFDPKYTNRWICDTPGFLQETPQPLHPGWKFVKNSGGGSCLFKAAADHIALKDFRHLRRYTHAHMEDQWYFFKPFYTFPLEVRIGAGDDSYVKNFEDDQSFVQFLRSEESMHAWNVSSAEIIALGHVLNKDVTVLTYNMRNRKGPNTARTEWGHYELHLGYAAPPNVFSRRTTDQMRLLHEDEAHFSCLVWFPHNATQAAIPMTDLVAPVSSTPQACTNLENTTPQKAGSMTRHRCKAKKNTKIRIEIINTPVSEILDRMIK